MTDLRQFTELKAKVEQAQQKADRAQGSLDQLNKQLKEEFDCDDLEEAETKLEELTKEEKSISKEFETALKQFEDRWKEKIGQCIKV